MPLFEPAYILAASLALAGADLAQPVAPDDVACLALNIYHEARGEPTSGQAAVAHVTINRAQDPRFPDSLCAVVTQRQNDVCQFSWHCQNPSWRTTEPDSFRKALGVAVAALTGERRDPTSGATHFISTRIDMPSWARRLHHTTTIGGHRFFRY